MLGSLFAFVILMIAVAEPVAYRPVRLEPAAFAGDPAQLLGLDSGPVDPVQWTVRDVVGSLDFYGLYNTERRQHLGGSASWQWWEKTPPGRGPVFFENCTRPGETIYGSDLVALRFGGDFVTYRNLSNRPVLTPSNRSCEFRLIPSGSGLVPAGSGDRNFALYNTRGNRYLVYKKEFRLNLASTMLHWQEPSNRRPPGGVSARADFVPVSLLFTDPKVVYLTIRNIGNVASSASQQEMEIRINGQAMSFVIPSQGPLPPGGYRMKPLRYAGKLCTPMVVVIDTSTKLKFQVLRGAFPNDDVFANDRQTIAPEFRGSARPQGRPGAVVLYPPCRGGVVSR